MNYCQWSRQEWHRAATTYDLLVVALVEPFGLELLLLPLEGLELFHDIDVDKVGDVLSIEDFGLDIVLPVGVLQQPSLCNRHKLCALAAILSHATIGPRSDSLLRSWVKIPLPIISCSSSRSNLILSGSSLSYFFLVNAAAGMNAGRSTSSRFEGMAT